MPESLLVSTVGLDGVLLLRFFKMGAHLFAVLSFFGLSIIAPVNYYANPPQFENSTGILYEDVLIPALTVENVPHQSPSLWIHLFCTWFFSLVAYAYLITYYRGLVNLKLQYVDHVLRRTKMSKIELRSIIVFGIPRELRHEVDLASYFEGLGIGRVENVVICRKWSRLREAVQNRAYYLTKLEKVYAAVMRNLHKRPPASGLPMFRNGSSGSAATTGPILHSGSADSGLGIDLGGRGSEERFHVAFSPDESEDLGTEAYRPLATVGRRFTTSDPVDASIFELMSRLDAVDPRKRPTHRTGFLGLRGAIVDSAEYYADKFKEWDRKVRRLRSVPESSPATSAGFVTFESPESAILASQVRIHRRPFACMARQAPEPRDIFWVNLSSKVAVSYIKMFRSVAVAATLFVLVFFSTIIVTAISALISLEKLQKTFPGLTSFLDNLGPGWTQFIQGVIPAVVTAAWTSSLPAVLILLAQAQGLEAQSWIDASVLSKYFFYQLWNILLVQTVASKVWQSVYDIIRHGPGEIIDALGSLVPSAAPLQINYVMLQATAVYPAQLLLVGPLILTWLTRMVPWSRSTPRQVSDAYYPSVLTSINYGIAYPVPILVFCVGLTYAPVAPLILPFCAMFYAIAWFVYKYMLLYVNIPRYETGGKHAPMAVRRCLAGILIMQMTMMGVLALKAGSGIKTQHHGDDKNDPFIMDDKGGAKLRWTGYVQMVVGVMPLLVITSLLYWWFKHGFEQLVENTPIDVVGAVAKDLARSRNDVGASTDALVIGDVEKGKELATVTPGRRTGNVNGTLGKRASIRAIRGRVRKGSTGAGDRGIGQKEDGDEDWIRDTSDHRPLSTATDREVQSSSRGPVGAASSPTTSDVNDQASSPLRFEMINEESFDGQAYRYSHDLYGGDDEATSLLITENDETQSLLHDDHEHPPSDTEDATPTPHLEPPMTRVPGILDAPFISATAIVPAGDEADNTASLYFDNEEDDLQIHTYVHPALIGRLPVAWVPGTSQPRRIQEAREEQRREQKELYRRIVGRQRVGVWELADGDETAGRTTNSAGQHTSRDGVPGDVRVGRRRRDSGVVRKVLSFVDGVTSWAHLSMS
ncbi:hypothetical protein SpCBS45565_g01605 [Spizellomyces sp. 'palustris']|nr:hypothetical protein SpCBS45565_g01605 [Spizellomyces sp. 'palustris']